MTDRMSSERIGQFTLSVDRDHRGRYRGQQAMDRDYRGYHYHIEADHMKQQEIMDYLEQQLATLGAEKCDPTQFIIKIGVVEEYPKKLSLWYKDRKSTVLWISNVTGGLHIESNKQLKYSAGILGKENLKDILLHHGCDQKGCR